MASSTALLEAVIRRDRLVLVAGMLVVLVLAWGWLILGAGTDMSAIGMTRMAGMDGWMMQPAVWTPAYALVMVSMWWVMMVAMMLPNAAPILLLFARLNRLQPRLALDPASIAHVFPLPIRDEQHVGVDDDGAHCFSSA